MKDPENKSVQKTHQSTNFELYVTNTAIDLEHTKRIDADTRRSCRGYGPCNDKVVSRGNAPTRLREALDLARLRHHAGQGFWEDDWHCR